MSDEFEHTILDLLVVGGGAAGMAAALEASSHGLTTVIVDENPDLGGQIYRSASRTSLDDTVLGKEYFRGASLIAAVTKSHAVFWGCTTVWMVDKGPEEEAFSIGIRREGTLKICYARRVLLATGALERPFPIPGWTLPGVMTAGAAQTMLKASTAVPSGPVVLAGTGPLLYLLAAQYARANVPIAAVLDTTPRRNWLNAAPYLPRFLTSSFFRKGLKLVWEVRRATRVFQNVTSIAAEGDDRVQAINFTNSGRNTRIEAETLLLHQGVTPQVNLAMAAGCKHLWSEERLAFEPILDRGYRSSVPGISIAGDNGGIVGAIAAEHTGRIAALHLADDLGKAPTKRICNEIAFLKRELRKALKGRRFIEALFLPAEKFRQPENDVIICRCEEVTAGDLRNAASRGAHGPNQAKTFLRSGMGPCQGRLCGLTVTEILAREWQKSPGEIGHLHIRNPVKPITMGELAGLKNGEQASRLF